MASQVLVRGRVQHAKMESGKVLNRLMEHFPQVQMTGQDFSISVAECKVNCFRSSSTTLDFTIELDPSESSSKSAPQRVVAATEILVRSTDTVWSGFSTALRTRRIIGTPKMDYCVIEDVSSKNSLIIREHQSPLWSPAAKVTYLLVVVFLITMAVLIHWQDTVHQADSARTANLLAVVIPLAVAAIGTPLPVFIQVMEWKKGLVWRYVRSSS